MFKTYHDCVIYIGWLPHHPVHGVVRSEASTDISIGETKAMCVDTSYDAGKLSNLVSDSG